MSDDLWSKLAAPFPAEVVSWRVGSVNVQSKRGMALAYIDARDVMQRLDLIVGPENWQCKYSHVGSKTVCDIGIRVSGGLAQKDGGGITALPDGWVWKADGAGDSDVEAEKGALSDAFKRAAVRWGVGRYLYDLPAPWVAIEPMGKSWKIADPEIPRLQQLLSGGAKTPANSPKVMQLKDATRKLMQTIRDCADEDALDELLTDADVRELRADLKRLLPTWSDGEAGGLEDLIISTRRAFKTGSMAPAIERGPPKGHPVNDPFDL